MKKCSFILTTEDENIKLILIQYQRGLIAPGPWTLHPDQWGFKQSGVVFKKKQSEPCTQDVIYRYIPVDALAVLYNGEENGSF